MHNEPTQPSSQVPTLTSSNDLLEVLSQIQGHVAALTTAVSRLTPISLEPEAGYVNLATNPSKEWVSIRQAAYILNISEKSVRRLINRNLLNASKGLRHIRIHVDEIAAYKARTV